MRALILTLFVLVPLYGSTISSIEICVSGNCSTSSDYTFSNLSLGNNWQATGEVSVSGNAGGPLGLPLAVTIDSLSFTCDVMCGELTAWITVAIETDGTFPSLTYNTTLVEGKNVGLIVQENFSTGGAAHMLVNRSAEATYSFSSSSTTGSSILDGIISLGFPLASYNVFSGGSLANVTSGGGGSGGTSNSTGGGGVIIVGDPVTVGTINDLVLSLDNETPEPAYTIPVALILAAGGAGLTWYRRKRA